MLDTPKKRIIFQDGEPCKHVGCRNHISHPCEGCGRIAARGLVYENPFVEKYKYYQHGDTGRVVKTNKTLAGEWFEITEEQYKNCEESTPKRMRLHRDGFQDLIIRPVPNGWQILEHTDHYGGERWVNIDTTKFNVDEHIQKYAIPYWKTAARGDT